MSRATNCRLFFCPACGHERRLPAFMSNAKHNPCPACGATMKTSQRRKISHEEHYEQAEFMVFANSYLPEFFRELIYSNQGGVRTFRGAAIKAKQEGMKRGIPDIHFAWPRLGFASLYIEMKRKDGGKLSQDQREMIDTLRYAGHAVAVCHGAEEAKLVLRWYFLSTESVEAVNCLTR